MNDFHKFQAYLKERQVPEGVQNTLKRVYEKVNQTIKYHEVQFTSFLDPETVHVCLSVFSSDEVNLMAYGGYEDAEYQMVGVFPTYVTPSKEDFPIVLLQGGYAKKFGQLGHRDLMGAVMALGIERKVFGDLLVHEDLVQVWVQEKMADYFTQTLDKIGRFGVQLAPVSPDLFVRGQEAKKPMSCSVHSLRLDALVASVYHVSRGQADKLIHAGHVKVNYGVEQMGSRVIKPGDMISVKHKGRFYFESQSGQSKKGRLRVVGSVLSVK